MGLELPVLSAVVARLPQPEINLAAYGGVVHPICLIVESPIIMLLAASTALSKDWDSYQLIRRFMNISAALLTGLHVLIAFTPLYYLVVSEIIGVPAEIVEPARWGLMILTPWTASIAYRRFNQGVMIRFGHSRLVGAGTVIRLGTNILVLAAGYLIGTIPGIIVGASAVAAGVVSEALYVGYMVRPILAQELKPAIPVDPKLNWQVFRVFYFPLVMTSLLTLLANPIGSAAISRMPQALDSLAIWPVITGLIFFLRSLGIAYNEVVVALLDEPNAFSTLKRFAVLLALSTSAFLLIMSATFFSQFWFVNISGLPEKLAGLAQRALWIALPLPAISVMQSWFMGAILHGKLTQSITESVVVYLLTSIIVLGMGVVTGNTIGLYVGLLGITLSAAMQTAWLWLRSRGTMQSLNRRDRTGEALPLRM